MMPRGLFVTGTNTGVGKTYVATLIAQSLVAAGRRVGVYKPVESGCHRDGERLIAADATALWQAAGQPGQPSQVCPQRFEAALAPPQAAAQAGQVVDGQLLRSGLNYWWDQADFVLVEGAGGLMSPLSDTDYNIDLARDLGLPLLIVTANKLGTINATLQTLITAQARAPQLPVAGLVLSQHQQLVQDESTASNAQQLAHHCQIPLLATLDFQQSAFTTAVDWFALGETS